MARTVPEPHDRPARGEVGDDAHDVRAERRVGEVRRHGGLHQGRVDPAGWGHRGVDRRGLGQRGQLEAGRRGYGGRPGRRTRRRVVVAEPSDEVEPPGRDAAQEQCHDQQRDQRPTDETVASLTC